MKRIFLLLALAASLPASAQIYRWTDAQGRTHFSNAPPPAGTRAVVVDPDAKAGPPSPESLECHTLRCQGERMEERQRKRESEDARIAAERAAAAARQPQYRGLDFRAYLSIRAGMTEGELLGIAGPPDLKANQGIALAAPVSVQGSRNLSAGGRAGLTLQTWTWMPTAPDPYTTTVTLVGGRVSEVERVRKF